MWLQTWSVDISPSWHQVEVLAKPCCAPRGHGPKAGKQTGTPPLESSSLILWSFNWKDSYLIALVPSSIALGLTKISSSPFTCHLFIEGKNNYDTLSTQPSWSLSQSLPPSMMLVLPRAKRWSTQCPTHGSSSHCQPSWWSEILICF